MDAFRLSLKIFLRKASVNGFFNEEGKVYSVLRTCRPT